MKVEIKHPVTGKTKMADPEKMICGETMVVNGHTRWCVRVDGKIFTNFSSFKDYSKWMQEN